MNESDIRRICEENHIRFVNRSFGQQTTTTLSFSQIQQIALEFYKLGIKKGVEVATIKG